MNGMSPIGDVDERRDRSATRILESLKACKLLNPFRELI
jgi:hypothetical protein